MKEMIHYESCDTRADSSIIILEYIISFNNFVRGHSYLDYLSPIEIENDMFN